MTTGETALFNSNPSIVRDAGAICFFYDYVLYGISCKVAFSSLFAMNH